jgi:hypothetical protein
MRSSVVFWAAALVVLTGAGGGAVALARHELGRTTSSRPLAGSPASPAAPPVVPGTTVYLDPEDRTMTFLPLGAGRGSARLVSEQRAYNVLVQDASKLSPIPATVRAYYGLLTDADTTPLAVDRRVWGFAVEAGCVHPGGRPGRRWSASRPVKCRDWEFVDARTGRDLGVIEQEVLPG